MAQEKKTSSKIWEYLYQNSDFKILVRNLPKIQRFFFTGFEFHQKQKDSAGQESGTGLFVFDETRNLQAEKVLCVKIIFGARSTTHPKILRPERSALDRSAKIASYIYII